MVSDEQRKAEDVYVMEANIARFRSILRSEDDPIRRTVIIRLLAVEEGKLAGIARSQSHERIGNGSRSS